MQDKAEPTTEEMVDKLSLSDFIFSYQKEEAERLCVVCGESKERAYA